MEDSELAARFSGRRALITGGLGMIGSTIANRLVPLGAAVTIADAMIKPFGANLFNIREIKDKVRLEIFDIRDKDAVGALVRDQDYIFNLAGQVSHNDSLENPFLDAEINYIGHMNILEAVRQHARRVKVLFSGSRLQYGKIENVPVTEDHPLRPLTPYALNKQAAENLYSFYNRVYGIQTVAFRISNPYGPRAQMSHGKYAMINWFMRLAMDDRTITIYGDGNQVRDYIYIDDLAEAFILAALNEEANGQVFNLGSGVGTRFREMAALITEVVGKGRIQFVPWPKDYVSIETGDYVSDITKIRAVLGWSPKTSLSEGIRSTYRYYEQFKAFYWN